MSRNEEMVQGAGCADECDQRWSQDFLEQKGRKLKGYRMESNLNFVRCVIPNGYELIYIHIL